MGRKTPSRSAGKGRGRGDRMMGLRKEDLEDEFDAFHKSRDKVALDSDGEQAEDSDNEEAVMDLRGADSEDEEDEADAEEDYDEEDDDEELGGMAGKLARQARFMKQKLAQMGVGQEEDEEEDKEDEESKLWGKKKRAYYSADNVDYELTDDEEAPKEEEEEVLRLQKRVAANLRPEDFGESEEDLEEEREEDDTMLATLKKHESKEKTEKSKTKGKKKDDVPAVEVVKKDVAALTEEEKMGAVMSEAPELVGLLAELREGLKELKEKLQPLLKAVKEGQYATADGISYLEAKHLLLLTYCQNIIFYLLLKAEGRPVREHPVIARLVELRLWQEKLRPIDKKLQYQIEKLLQAAKNAETAPQTAPKQKGDKGDADALQFKPNPNALVSKLPDGTSQEDGGLYRPPMLTPAAMEEDPDKRKRKEERASKEARRKASRSQLIRDLAEEIQGRPEEIREALEQESAAALRERRRLVERADAEENLFVRVPLTKVERKKQKALNLRSGLGALLDDFNDDVAGLVEVADELDGDRKAGGPPEDLLKKKRLSQVVAEAGRPAKRPREISGDADVPLRDPLGDRRRKLEDRLVSRRAEAESDEDVGVARKNAEGIEDDPFYAAAKEANAAKKARKAAKYSREGVIPQEEEEADSKRGINYQIEKNRGLTPHRKKDTKNPRKKLRVKHAKAVVRRKGQVRDVKKPSAAYGGETTGIKANLSRSVRMG